MMKTWLKPAAAILAAALLMTGAAGCGGQKEPTSSGGSASRDASKTSTLNPDGYDFGGKTVTIASTYIKLDEMLNLIVLQKGESIHIIGFM